MTRGSGWGRARAGLLAALLPALLAASCQEPRTASDCDQIIGQHRYDEALRDCKSPYHRASAYLGKAGVDLIALASSDQPSGKVAALLRLTPGDVDARRLLINLAVAEVKQPKIGSEAFALLVAAYFGLAVTMEQFLDNGLGAGTVALDDTVAQSEVDAAIGLVSQTASIKAAPPTLPGNPTQQARLFAAVVSGSPYVLDCSADSAPFCQTAATHVYDDPDGSGLLNLAVPPPQSGSAAGVIASVATGATSVGYSAQFMDLVLPLGFQDPAVLKSFVGAGDPNAGYNVGIAAYLNYLQAANAALGGTSSSTVGKNVDALVTRLDNGAGCPATQPIAPALSLIDEMYAVYVQAPGTAARPAPASPPGTYYQTLNLVATSSVPTLGLLLPVPAGPYAFPGATVSSYKFLFPTVPGQTVFDATRATPRVDQAYPAFVTEFENVPQLAPAAAKAKDGRITVLELLCSGG